MRPVGRSGGAGHAWEDLTARARIRETALLHFAERGVNGTTIRGVAEGAGVSPALVQHHFGSKEGLRDACDNYVLETIRGLVRQAIDDDQIDDPDFLSAAYRAGSSIVRYLGRALVDGSPAAASLFDELVAVTEEYLTNVEPAAPRVADVRADAAVLLAMRLGVWALHEHLARALGVEDLTPDVLPRVSAAMLDIISPDLVGPDVMARARAGLERYRRTTTHTTHPPRPGTTGSRNRVEEEHRDE